MPDQSINCNLQADSGIYERLREPWSERNAVRRQRVANGHGVGALAKYLRAGSIGLCPGLSGSAATRLPLDSPKPPRFRLSILKQDGRAAGSPLPC